MSPKKGCKLYHNLETKESLMFAQDPGPPWVQGRPPWQPQTRNPEQYEKSSLSKKLRMESRGHTEAELEGYKKLSQTRRNGDYSPSYETRQKIRKSLEGRPQKWEENKSRASCRRAQCDTIYIILCTTSDGHSFGKWGSTKEKTFVHREKEFTRKKLTWKIVYWGSFGKLTEDVEAKIGRALSKYPDTNVPHFYGHTETFIWNEQTQQLLEEIINGLG
jgi:hypothetical protein